MALIHNAQLVPSKIELLREWLPKQPWWTVGSAAIDPLGAYRFDDPAGEVGIETHLVSVGGDSTVQVPLTYRAAPLAGAENALVGTMEHSVLGARWVYDGCDDPVYLAALATTILTGGTEAEENVETDTGLRRREPSSRVTGSGTPGTAVPPTTPSARTSDDAGIFVRTGGFELFVRHALDRDVVTTGAQTLTGVWPGNPTPVVLALARTS
jgi:hypothetical protein